MREITLLTVCTILCTLVSEISASTYYQDNSLFFEEFGPGWDTKWVHTKHEKYQGKFSLVTPEGWTQRALQIPEKSKFYGISAKASEPIDPSEGLVVQYEVKFSEGITCGGAYVKLITATSDFSESTMSDQSPYTIMFGPDSCGTSHKVHVIFRYKNPNGTIEEKHLKDAPTVPNDERTHIYTLILTPDNKYEVLIDEESTSSGSILDKFEPSFLPPKEIPDPADKKPADWVDQAKIPDPSAQKPDDWEENPQIPDPKAKKPAGWLDDEPALITDPAAKKPEDWDDEEDGEWEPSMISNPKCIPGCGEWKRPLTLNPKYKGPWTAPVIDNPAYKGEWVQKTIPNPDYFEDATPLKNVGKIGAVAIEVWTVDSGYTFGGIMITSDKIIAKEYRNRVWKKQYDAEERLSAEQRKAAAADDRKSLADVIVDAFDLPYLSSVKPFVEPALDFLQEHEWLAYVIFVSPVFLASAVLFCCRPKKADSGVGKRKKEDITEEDVDEEEEEQEQAPAAKAGKKTEAKTSAAAGGSKVKHSEIEAEEEDEEEEEDAGPARRRKGKA